MSNPWGIIKLVFVFAAGFCLSLNTLYAVHAQDGLPDASGVEAAQPPEILTEEMILSEDAYKRVRDTLQPEQKKILEDLENNYLLTLAPEMEVARLSWQLKSCDYKDKAQKEEDASIFSAFKLEKKRETQTLKEKAAAAFKDKTSFIDAAVLTRHIAVIMHFGRHVSLQALRGQMIDTDAKELCDQGRKTLKAYSKQ